MSICVKTSKYDQYLAVVHLNMPYIAVAAYPGGVD